MFVEHHHEACAISISDEVKRQYALASGADLSKLLDERIYKEQHRPALMSFWQKQVQARPQLPEEEFMRVVNEVEGLDVLIIIGMRDAAPATVFSPLVPESRVVEVRIERDDNTLGLFPDPSTPDYRPSFTFINSVDGNSFACQFAKNHLLPFLHADLDKLASMVRPIPNFPSTGIAFRHILGIAKEPGGLALCTSLLQNHFIGDWNTVDKVVAPEVGGILFASALAMKVDVPLWLVREGAKLPPPKVAVGKSMSFVSSALGKGEGIMGEGEATKEKKIEIEQDVVSRGGSVVVIDDVLSTGKTLCAVLELLKEAGIDQEDVSVLVVAEFPEHRGRELLWQRGFGRVSVRSLLVFGGN